MSKVEEVMFGGTIEETPQRILNSVQKEIDDIEHIVVFVRNKDGDMYYTGTHKTFAEAIGMTELIKIKTLSVI